jgi:hypothetical protein
MSAFVLLWRRPSYDFSFALGIGYSHGDKPVHAPPVYKQLLFEALENGEKSGETREVKVERK